MYMYDFFYSLDLLQQVPNINDLPRGNYLYFGICKKDELIQRGYKVSCDKLYLTYARYDDLSNLSYYPIDKFYNYMNQLTSNLIDLNELDNNELKASLFEAIWLINEIAYLEEIPFFNAKLNIEVSTLCDMIDHNGDEFDHSIDYFDNIGLLKKIHIAQIRYFISQYLRAKLKINKTYSNIDLAKFDSFVLDSMNRFIEVAPIKYKVEIYTNLDNPEFDSIFEQIVVLNERQSNKT